jgi:hypothetical protein
MYRIDIPRNEETLVDGRNLVLESKSILLRTLLLALLLLTPICYAHGQNAQPKSEKPGIWRVDGTPAENTPEHKAVGGFGAHLIVIKDPRAFIEMWQRPEMPRFETAKVVGFDESIGVLVLFAGCKSDSSGICNAEVDYCIYKPDGTILTEQKKQKLWKREPPPAKVTQLGQAVLGFRTAKTLPVGEYKVTAKIYDLNADVSFELRTQFELKQ